MKANHLHRIFKSILCACVTTVCASSCVYIDDHLGENFIPTNQQYDVYTMAFPLKNISMAYADSLSGFSSTRFTVGSIRDPETGGLTSRSSASTLVPLNEEMDFGEDPQVIQFHFTAVKDTVSCIAEDEERILQNIRVYEVKKDLGSKYIYTSSGYRMEDDGIIGDKEISAPIIYNGGDSLSFDFTKEFSQTFIETLAKKFADIRGVLFAQLQQAGVAYEVYEKVEEMGDVDVLIVLGGDGTILRAAHDTGARIFGINAGGVGFLTAVEREHIEEGISRLRRGDYTVDRRAKIAVSVDGEWMSDAVNEAMVHTDSVAKIRQFRVTVDGSLLTEVKADGFMLSTVTGSTSYAMSLGAPIMDPRVGDAWILVPIAAFRYSSRPIILPTSARVTIEAVMPDKGCLLVVDGQREIPVEGGSVIELTRSPECFRLIEMGADFYQKVRDKLVTSL